MSRGRKKPTVSRLHAGVMFLFGGIILGVLMACRCVWFWFELMRLFFVFVLAVRQRRYIEPYGTSPFVDFGGHNIRFRVVSELSAEKVHRTV